jgi:hypothetical protein
MPLRKLSDGDKKELNEFMNLTDPMKDTFMNNTKQGEEDFSLDKAIHGPLINDIVDLLYDTKEEQSAGGRFAGIEKKITEKFGENLFTRGSSQQFSCLRFDANNNRSFSIRKGKIAIDTGKPEMFGENCNAVVGPFSIVWALRCSSRTQRC